MMKIIENSFDLDAQGVQILQKVIINVGEEEETWHDAQYTSITLPKSFRNVRYFTSSWGQEFTAHEIAVNDNFQFENVKGRCGAQSNPFFTISDGTRYIDIAISTAGNYRVKIRCDKELVHVDIEDGNTDFCTLIPYGEEYHCPTIYAHAYRNMTQCYREKQLFLKEKYENSGLHHDMDTIYNHWWAYEDKHINEEVILKNAAVARDIGLELLVLDAGWFGSDDDSEHWEDVRGDWNLVNRERFPDGIRGLSEKIRAMGLKFGIWCEIEGLGKHAQLACRHPEYAARRDGKELGYVCFAQPEVQQWAIDTMSRLFDETQASYWKLDFNLDPGIGCDCEGHHHGKEDGLYRHYKGLFHVLHVLKERYPNVVFENCSSGGQRLSIKMNDYFDVQFMSDPDYSSHQLRLFKEISRWLMPSQILHFMWSNTVDTNDSRPFPDLNLDTCTIHELRYHMRLAFMHNFGMSHRLMDYAPATLQKIKQEITLYKNKVRDFIQHGDYCPLLLESSCEVFCFSKETESLVFIFTQETGIKEISLHALSDMQLIIDLDDPEHEVIIKDGCYTLSAEHELECHILQITHGVKRKEG